MEEEGRSTCWWSDKIKQTRPGGSPRRWKKWNKPGREGGWVGRCGGRKGGTPRRGRGSSGWKKKSLEGQARDRGRGDGRRDEGEERPNIRNEMRKTDSVRGVSEEDYMKEGKRGRR